MLATVGRVVPSGNKAIGQADRSANQAHGRGRQTTSTSTVLQGAIFACLQTELQASDGETI